MAAMPAKATPIIDTEPTNTPDEFSYKQATFEEVLEDLSSRFILNLPEDELAEVERVCFQVEQAHWYYEDFIRDENPSFPSLPLKKFSEILFRSCPLLRHWSNDHETAFNGFMSYKIRVPVCGAIMLNEALSKCVLVKGWKSSAGWGFPKGKVNENEDEAFCAVREVLEETGYNLSGQIRRTDCIRLCVKQQPITLFVVAGVPEEFPFKTQTRKEISKIDWFKLADLPSWKKNRPVTSKFYLITPVIGPLKAIVRNLRKTRKTAKPHSPQDPDSVEGEDEREAEDAGTAVTVERRSQSCEAEISSSQSSSIDPHTPSVNGDLGPATSSGDKVIIKHSYPDLDDTEAGDTIDMAPSSFTTDSRTHWSRLMTRLNHSQENSPQTTPEASTPTPSVPKSPPGPELQPREGASSHRGSTEVPNDGASRRPLTCARSFSMSSSSLSSERSGSTVPLPPRGLARSPSSGPSSSEQLIKRTRQLQLLESVVAESSERSHLTVPLSAHTLGAFPRPSSVLIPDQGRALVRSASVNPEAARSQLTPYHHHHHHHTQHTHSMSSFSGLLPGPLYGHPAAAQGGKRPPQLGLPLSSPTVRLPYGQNTSVDSVHKGQMLSILSGGKASATQGGAAAVAPHSSHLLSILNNSPRTPTAGHGARQLNGG